jgi:hypothetical protein
VKVRVRFWASELVKKTWRERRRSSEGRSFLKEAIAEE